MTHPPNVTFTSLTLMECLVRCQDGIDVPDCVSADYHPGTLQCEMSRLNKGSLGVVTTLAPGWVHFEKYCG